MSTAHAARLSALRAELDARGLHGFVVPLVDEHNSEYVADYAQRLAWLTGFKGSQGSAIILSDRAAVFVDGRYVLQVKDQVNGTLFEHVHIADQSPLDWLASAVADGNKIGYDPKLHTPGWVKQAAAVLKRHGAELIATDDNPVDAVWTDQPIRPPYEITPHDVSYAGVASSEKRTETAAILQEKGADTAVITALDSIAWLFNIRGRDVAHTPVALSYALLHKDGTAELFIAPQKLTDIVRTHLGNEVICRPYDSFYDALDELGQKGRSVLVDPDSANAAIIARLQTAKATLIESADPCALPKARKNPTEIKGTIAAHLRDGAAVTEFLHWIDSTSSGETLTELQCVDKLLSFRKKRNGFTDTSFDTISGAGPNGAIVHYRVTKDTSRKLEQGQLYLVDSGGQYPDGTTDITRTVPIGTVKGEECERFTAVLKGHIALATLRFPKGTTGAQIDAIARKPLWDLGLDYDHGTGHGVGSFLAVHEGPQRISKAPNAIALEPGMILSNEPGYYKNGGYGIRIENLVYVTEDKDAKERPFLRFETITLAPIDRRLIVTDMLSDDERRWVDRYHARVKAELSPLLGHEAQNWLTHMTAPLTV